MSRVVMKAGAHSPTKGIVPAAPSALVPPRLLPPPLSCPPVIPLVLPTCPLACTLTYMYWYCNAPQYFCSPIVTPPAMSPSLMVLPSAPPVLPCRCCSAGYYCPNVTTSILCPPGYFCKSQSLAPHGCGILMSCPAGTGIPQYSSFAFVILAVVGHAGLQRETIPGA